MFYRTRASRADSARRLFKSDILGARVPPAAHKTRSMPLSTIAATQRAARLRPAGVLPPRAAALPHALDALLRERQRHHRPVPCADEIAKSVRAHEAEESCTKSVALLGVPASDGQPLKGAEDGAKIARERGLLEQIRAVGHYTVDCGDIDVIAADPDDPISYSACGRVIKNAASVGRTTRLLFERMVALRMQGQLPVVVGGDHSIAAGSVASALHMDPDVGVLWVDAHADLHTPESSPSMNLHGMPLSFLMGLADPSKVAGLEWMVDYKVPVLKPSRLVYIGLRDIDLAERVMLRQLGITAFTMREVDKFGIAKVMELALAQLVNSFDAALHISFDIDALCPTWAPSTGTSVFGGLTMREANFIAESVAETGAVRSLDMVEVNPALGSDSNDVERTADMGNTIITKMLGHRLL